MGGVPFSDVVLPQDFRVLEVRVDAQNQVDGLQIVHETVNGHRRVFPLHGCAAEDCYVLQLDADEFITSIWGSCGAEVTSICIQTNKQTSPVLGSEGGANVNGINHACEYHYDAPSGAEIVGFWGRAGSRIDALGVIMRRRGL